MDNAIQRLFGSQAARFRDGRFGKMQVLQAGDISAAVKPAVRKQAHRRIPANVYRVSYAMEDAIDIDAEHVALSAARAIGDAPGGMPAVVIAQADSDFARGRVACRAERLSERDLKVELALAKVAGWGIAWTSDPQVRAGVAVEDGGKTPLRGGRQTPNGRDVADVPAPAPRAARLLLWPSWGEGAIPVTQTTVVGRGALGEGAISCPGQSVSRWHGEFYEDHDSWWYVDLSRYGTTANGVQLDRREPLRLVDGLQLGLGEGYVLAVDLGK